jgi:CRISPR-associated endonuclease Cas1
MQHRGGPRLLVTDRDSALYLERARVHVENGRVVYHATDDDMRQEFNIPHVNLAVLFLGQGTSITQEAARLLGEESVHVAFTGSGGSPLHMGALTTYSGTRHFREFLPIYLEERRSLPAAVSVMRDRIDRMRKIGGDLAIKHLRQRDASVIDRVCRTFEGDLKTCSSIQQVLGFEGQFSKACYKVFAEMAGESGFRRDAGTGDSGTSLEADPQRMVNRLIDHGNYLCYGIAGAALWGLGIPPHMSVFHGKTRAGGLVFDVADSFKDAVVLPCAFAAPRDKDNHENMFRKRVIDVFNGKEILASAIETVNRMIQAGSTGEMREDA